jgi:hypothetical protein
MIGVLKFENDLGTTHAPCIAGDMTAANVGETLRYVAGAGDRLSRSLSNIEHRARQILLDAGHDPDRPGLLPESLDDGCLLYDSHLILRHLNIFRSESISDPPATAWRAILIDRIANKHDFLAEHGEAIRRGRKFISGPKKGRKDVLARAIIEALEKLGAKASARQVLAFLKKNTKFEIDDDDAIHWTSTGGRERMTTFKACQNRIAELRRRS